MKYLTKNEWEAIVDLMDDETRERVHMELVPCTVREFLGQYLEIAPEFWNLLKQEFSFDQYDDADLPGVPEVVDYEELDTDAAEEVAARIRDVDYWDGDDVEDLCQIARIEAAWIDEDEPLEKLAEGAARILGVEIY